MSKELDQRHLWVFGAKSQSCQEPHPFGSYGCNSSPRLPIKKHPFQGCTLMEARVGIGLRSDSGSWALRTALLAGSQRSHARAIPHPVSAIKKHPLRGCLSMEARVGIAPAHRSFADSCLTAWLPGRVQSNYYLRSFFYYYRYKAVQKEFCRPLPYGAVRPRSGRTVSNERLRPPLIDASRTTAAYCLATGPYFLTVSNIIIIFKETAQPRRPNLKIWSFF